MLKWDVNVGKMKFQWIGALSNGKIIEWLWGDRLKQILQINIKENSKRLRFHNSKQKVCNL